LILDWWFKTRFETSNKTRINLAVPFWEYYDEATHHYVTSILSACLGSFIIIFDKDVLVNAHPDAISNTYCIHCTCTSARETKEKVA